MTQHDGQFICLPALKGEGSYNVGGNNNPGSYTVGGNEGSYNIGGNQQGGYSV